MTVDLDKLAALALAAQHGPWSTRSIHEDQATRAYIASLSPGAMLDLIVELRDLRAVAEAAWAYCHADRDNPIAHDAARSKLIQTMVLRLKNKK